MIERGRLARVALAGGVVSKRKGPFSTPANKPSQPNDSSAPGAVCRGSLALRPGKGAIGNTVDSGILSVGVRNRPDSRRPTCAGAPHTVSTELSAPGNTHLGSITTPTPPS
jgi:hypothetical protein